MPTRIPSPNELRTPRPRTRSTNMSAPTETADASRALLRRGIYLIIAAIAIGGLLGRIFAVNSVDKVALEGYLKGKGTPKQLQRPFLSGNDRSRWATVR